MLAKLNFFSRRSRVKCHRTSICLLYFLFSQIKKPIRSQSRNYKPLSSSYFTFPGPLGTLAEMEAVIYGEQGRLVMAHNGWVMNADPLQDFAAREHDGRVYIRRELIAWGDSVKLR